LEPDGFDPQVDLDAVPLIPGNPIKHQTAFRYLSPPEISILIMVSVLPLKKRKNGLHWAFSAVGEISDWIGASNDNDPLPSSAMIT